MNELPVLYSFRRCPYAMRARLALAASNTAVELREVVLRDKPQAMLEASPKGTVPVLMLPDGKILEESLDIINWSLGQNDAEGWLKPDKGSLQDMRKLVAESDGPFKDALDQYKYPNRHEGIDPLEQRERASSFIRKLNVMLEGQSCLYGEKFSFADGAILPFIRQFAHVDRDWFWSKDWKNVTRWLDAFLASGRLAAVMKKYPQWREGEEGVRFGSR